jgi:hypothetical protein
MEERISGIEDKVQEVLNSNRNKEKICNHDHNFQDFVT